MSYKTEWTFIWENRVTINCVPGHQENERADHLAELGSLKTQQTLSMIKYLPFQNYENKIEEHYKKSKINRFKISDIIYKAK